MTNDDLDDLFLRFRDAHDMRALAKLFDKTAPQLMPVAAHLAARRDEADDLLQATFLSAIERAASYERGRPVLPWLLGILALHARKLREKQGRVIDVERVVKPAANDPERAASVAELERAVDAACRELPATYATIVRRHLVEGADAGELARELGLSSGAARVRLHRGLKLLRRALPAAFASRALALGKSRGLAAIRERVLEHASQLTGAPIAVAASVAPVAVAFALLASIALAVPAWFTWRNASNGGSIALTGASTPRESSASVVELVEPIPPTETARALADDSTQATPSSTASTSAITAVVRGRVLLSSGAAATGANVRVHGWEANSERAAQFGMPADWHDPELVQTDASGRFEFSFDPPRAFQFTLDVESLLAAKARWRWSELEPGSTLDLGDVVLEPQARLEARILDASGHPLCANWSVGISAPAPPNADGREPTWLSTKCTPGDGVIAFEHVPARRVTVTANSQQSAEVKRFVELAPGATEQVDLIYDGPDLSRRITVSVSTRPFYVVLQDAPVVRISKPGIEPRVASKLPNRSDVVVDDLDPGAYDIVIEDARFVTWTQSNVQPGDIVHAKLVGNASARLSLVGADGTPYTGRYKATLRFPGAHFAPNTFLLVDPSKDPPPGNLLAGLVPGDAELAIEVEGTAAKTVALPGLAANETRDISCVLDSGATIAGRVLASDGATPMSSVDVQLTRGNLAGHVLGSNSSVYSQGAELPPVTARATSDVQGRFEFAGLAAGTWTLRAMWGRYLWFDRTVELMAQPQAVELAQPEHGFLAGRLLVPDGAPLQDTNLAPSILGAPVSANRDGRDPTELFDDWTFRFGPLPLGYVRLSLMVTTRDLDNEGTSASGSPLEAFTIRVDEETQAEIDLRATFPGRLRTHVLVDGAAVNGGEIRLRRLGESTTWGYDGRSVTGDGWSLMGSIRPGFVHAAYVSADHTWAWSRPQALEIPAGGEAQLELAIFTATRDMRCVNSATNEPLTNVEVAWRTDLDVTAHEAKAKTDALGRLHLKMPEQNIELRCSGDTGAWTTMAWSAGVDPLTVALRRAP